MRLVIIATPGLMHAARRHALVRRLDDDRDALRLQHLLQRVRDLHRHLLLDLQALRIDVDEPRELRDADDAMARQVGDVRAADDRHHVVLAIALDAHVPQHDHLVVTLDLLEGAREQRGGVDAVATEELLVRARDAPRRVAQAFARRVVAGPAQQRAHRGLGFLAAGTGDVGRFAAAGRRGFRRIRRACPVPPAAPFRRSGHLGRVAARLGGRGGRPGAVGVALFKHVRTPAAGGEDSFRRARQRRPAAARASRRAVRRPAVGRETPAGSHSRRRRRTGRPR